MHDIAFDSIHDEIAVTSPLAQAILSFRGAANGEEAPLRVIQGDKTQIKGVGATGKVSIDPVNNEILLATPDQTILTFDRLQMETCRRNEFSADSPRSSTLVSRTQ